jgi:hypothetical protein
MSITMQQALTASMFHEDHEPAGKIYQWRRNGATQTWKTRPGEFRIPVKYGARAKDQSQIWHYDAHRFHTEQDCPTRHVRVTMPDGAGEWSGIVTADHGNGITRVQVTTRGNSRHRVGSQVDVGTASITDL